MPSKAPLPSAAALLCAALLVACAPLPPSAPAASGDVVAPNRNLVVQGIPPVPRRIVDEVARYTDFRGQRFVDWHPLRSEMLISTRKAGGDTTQIFRLAAPLAEPEQLTDFSEPVRTASFEPTRGDYIVFERSTGGDEAAQLYRLDLATRQTTLLTPPDQRHNMQEWLHRSSRLLYLSLPLDRTAPGGSRNEVTQTLSLVDPMQPQAQRRLAELPGGGWGVSSVAWDDSQIALTRYLSAAESEVWLLDLASGTRKQVLPAAGQAPASYFADVWKRDGSGFFFLSDRAGEFRELMFFRVADGAQQRVTRSIPWDIDQVTLDASGRLLAVAANVEGRRELRFFDADTFDPLPTPQLPEGSVVALQFHPRLPLLASTLDGSRTPSTVGVIDPANGALQRWTTPFAPPGVHLASFAEQKIVRWPSFDGREISGLLALPPARFTGKRPVLVDIHGGPEGQATVGFLGRYNYFLEELGVAVIRPNVRGSSGFGKTFLALDNGMKREDSVKDIGALFDWIARQPQPRRLARDGLGRQLRRLHEPGGGDATTPTGSPARSTSSASRTSSPSCRTPRATGATCAGSSTATSAIRRCASSCFGSRRSPTRRGSPSRCSWCRARTTRACPTPSPSRWSPRRAPAAAGSGTCAPRTRATASRARRTPTSSSSRP